MTQITIKDIARKLNISPSTVSRALRSHPDISRATRDRVMLMAEQCNYQPNRIAQSLQTRQTNTIGVIVPEIKHNFFSSAISGIEGVANEAGFVIMVCQSNESYCQEVVSTRALLSHHVAGLLISISQETERVEHLDGIVRRRIPLVFFDRVVPGIAAGTIVVDDAIGARKAVDFLIGRGYQRIGHLAGPQLISVARERYNGYRQALQEAGIPIDPQFVVHGGFHEKDGYEGLQRLMALPRPPDAVFTVNDPVAIGAFRFVRERGLRIPGDVALVGFSNNPISSLIDPPLTTVDQPAFEIGRSAASLLIDQILSGEPLGEPEIRVLKTRLIVRGSA